MKRIAEILSPFPPSRCRETDAYRPCVFSYPPKKLSDYQYLPTQTNVCGLRNPLPSYACEWLPDKITWFFDGEVIFECNDRDEIPQYPMRIKVTHPLTDRAMNGNSPGWLGTDAVTIEYIKYYQIIFDCDTDIAIRNVNDIVGYEPGVKQTITMGASEGLEVPVGTDISLMASTSITIDKELTIPIGAKVTMAVHGCPETE